MIGFETQCVTNLDPQWLADTADACTAAEAETLELRRRVGGLMVREPEEEALTIIQPRDEIWGRVGQNAYELSTGGTLTECPTHEL
jgi:hypothetical protein